MTQHPVDPPKPWHKKHFRECGPIGKGLHIAFFCSLGLLLLSLILTDQSARRKFAGGGLMICLVFGWFLGKPLISDLYQQRARLAANRPVMILIGVTFALWLLTLSFLIYVADNHEGVIWLLVFVGVIAMIDFVSDYFFRAKNNQKQ